MIFYTSNKLKFFFQYNKKIIIGSTIIFIFIFIYYICNINIVKKEKEQEAFNEMAEDQNLFIQNFFKENININKFNIFGFKYIIDNFPQTKAAKLASYYCGIISFKKKQYKSAIKYFQKFSSQDEILNSINQGAIGDCYIELGEDSKALYYFEKALKMSNYHFISLYFTNKIGILFIQKKNYKQALNYYLTAKKKFPEEFEEYPKLNAYITMLEYKNEN